jgi:SAM-dependent methyltransferase
MDVTRDKHFVIKYDHERNRQCHSVEGAAEVLRALFAGDFPRTVLDVGCGTGTWLKAFLDRGAATVVGLDGIDPKLRDLFVPHEVIRHTDLRRPFDLGERFDLVLCLETAEHLDREYAGTLIDSLTHHGTTILFSAAAPGQPGDHHVNCEWPDYWQRLFNDRGYVCNDSARWAIWDNAAVEPWYRQNLITAVEDKCRAGEEPRIRRVLHPDMMQHYGESFLEENLGCVEAGALPVGWYIRTPITAASMKLRRLLRRLSS